MGEEIKSRVNIGVMGRVGSGKSYLVKKMLARFPRRLIYDPFEEYEGVLFRRWAEAAVYLDNFTGDEDGAVEDEYPFQVVYRPPSRHDAEQFFRMAASLKNYVLIAEEVEMWCKSSWINPHLERLISFGRHKCRSLVWITRSPFEINRDLTRQHNLLISFKQTEPRDIAYLDNYSFNKDITTLAEYEYAWYGDEEILKTYVA